MTSEPLPVSLTAKEWDDMCIAEAKFPRIVRYVLENGSWKLEGTKEKWLNSAQSVTMTLPTLQDEQLYPATIPSISDALVAGPTCPTAAPCAETL